MDRAIEVKPVNRHFIELVNNGEYPTVGKVKTYLVVSEDPQKQNLLLSNSQFHRNFRFCTKERPNGFTYVEETF